MVVRSKFQTAGRGHSLNHTNREKASLFTTQEVISTRGRVHGHDGVSSLPKWKPPNGDVRGKIAKL